MAASALDTAVPRSISARLSWLGARAILVMAAGATAAAGVGRVSYYAPIGLHPAPWNPRWDQWAISIMLIAAAGFLFTVAVRLPLRPSMRLYPAVFAVILVPLPSHPWWLGHSAPLAGLPPGTTGSTEPEVRPYARCSSE